jgi:hypothetical protein
MIIKFQKMLRPIEMLAATDQDIKKFVPDVQGWIKINVSASFYFFIHH